MIMQNIQNSNLQRARKIAHGLQNTDRNIQKADYRDIQIVRKFHTEHNPKLTTI